MHLLMYPARPRNDIEGFARAARPDGVIAFHELRLGRSAVVSSGTNV